jgi:hypothetical protein
VFQQAAVAATMAESQIERLARFFPSAIRISVPVRVSAVAASSGSAEDTVIEFGTANEVLFSSVLPLEFEDKVRLKSADGSLDAEADVVAVQLSNGKLAIAARFSRTVANWIIKAKS